MNACQIILTQTQHEKKHDTTRSTQLMQKTVATVRLEESEESLDLWWKTCAEHGRTVKTAYGKDQGNKV